MYVEADNNGYSHGVGYGYDTINNLTTMAEIINGVEYVTSYTYDDDNRLRQTSVAANQNTVNTTYTYDSYGRLEWVDVIDSVCDTISREYRYHALSGVPTMQIEEVQYDAGWFVLALSYDYDGNGNIISVSSDNFSITYAYDSQNQLVRENNSLINKTYTWTYDNAGNILNRKEYAYTTGTLGTVVDTVNYSYGDSDWGDLLTAYDGAAITYDGMGNPLNDGTWTCTWEHGRQLASMSDGTTTWTYTYDANGLRTSRTNGTVTYSYVYNGNQLVQMKKGNDTLYFIYDATGAPTVVMYNGVPYYYITNLQGDTLCILDSADNIMVEYVLDAWGNVDSISGTMASTLGTLNPLIYRGYVYDHDTGLYYLQSRYYDPEMGRFLNADALISTGQDTLGNNMFAYCLNNPVNYFDKDGDRADSIFGWIGEEIGELIYEWITGEDHPNDQAEELENEIISTQTEMIAVAAEATWDTYMRGYNIQQEVQHQQLLLQHELYNNVYNYVTDDGFWLTDVGVVTQSTLVSAGVGAGMGFVSSIKPALALLPISPHAALATVGSATLHGLINGAISGFIGGLATIAIW